MLAIADYGEHSLEGMRRAASSDEVVAEFANFEDLLLELLFGRGDLRMKMELLWRAGGEPQKPGVFVRSSSARAARVSTRGAGQANEGR